MAILLADIDLGRFDADLDEMLLGCFLQTATYGKAHAGEKVIIIGGKGSGKSAIKCRLMEEIYDDDSCLVIELSPDQYSWKAARDFIELGVGGVHAHASAWRLTLLAASIYELSKRPGTLPKSTNLRKYYPLMYDAYDPGEMDRRTRAGRTLRRIINSVRTIYGSLFWPDPAPPKNGLEAVNRIQSILASEWPSSGLTLRILVDKLDDIWDSDQKVRDCIAGALKATSEVNADLAGHLMTTVFVRDDIYDVLSFDDKDHVDDLTERLAWEAEKLEWIVAERIRSSCALGEVPNEEVWDQIFASPKIDGKTCVAYMIDRTFLRPRHLLSFFRKSIERAMDEGHSTIENKDIKHAETTAYSRERVDGIVVDHRAAFPQIRILLQYFNGSQYRLSKEELRVIIDRFKTDQQRQIPEEFIINLLFTWGVIGVKHGAKYVYSYQDAALNPCTYDTFAVHPGLRSHLNVSS
ncbi:MAG: hypothetical protein E4H08_08935 [Candidatus Atribacteria bacterium]|nr:MAG: hypothetical protein E4H08_08935 [Candidatus Atribacteria bacterium]